MRTVIAAIVVGFALVLSGCSSAAPTPTATLVEVTHSQSKAVPDFDSSEQRETDADRLAELQGLIEEYDWSSSVVPQDLDGCTGGTSTDLKLTWSDGTTDEWGTYRCGGDNPEFVVALTELIASWR